MAQCRKGCVGCVFFLCVCVIWVTWPFNSHEEFEYEHNPLGSFVLLDFPNVITDCHLFTPIKSCMFESFSCSFLQIACFNSSCSSTISKEVLLSPARRKQMLSVCEPPEGFGATVSVYTNKYNPPYGLNCCLMTQWCSDWKRMSITSGITVITLYLQL